MTYSIVAKDQETGCLGVAVQSCMLAAGTRVPFARHGVGAVAVQAGSEIWHGHAALDLLERGADAQGALAGLVAVAEEDDVQFGIVDRDGGAAAYTGPRCAREAGHATGDGATAQANVMAAGSPWVTMLDTYRTAEGDFPDRLLAALRAAEAAGGDLRGRQSAALLVASPDPHEEFTYHCPDGPVVDLRTDDHDDPVEELERLLELKRAHDHLIRAVRCANEDWAEAVRQLERGSALAPDDALLGFWQKLSLLLDSEPSETQQLLTEAVAQDRTFAERMRRLGEAELIHHPGLARVLELLRSEEGLR